MKGSTAIKVFIILFAAIFVAHQCFSTFYRPIKTESACYYTAQDGLNTTGLIIRNETVLTDNNNGVMHFLIPDGGRVSKNGVISNIYNSENASITLSNIDIVQKKILDIKDLLSYNDLEAADLDMINSKITKNLNSLIVAGSNGDYQNYTEYADILLSSINRRQVAMGSTDDFSSQLVSLNNQLSKLSSSLPAAEGQVRAQSSGYFISKTDGYENVLKCENLEKITPEFLSNIKPESQKEKNIGKIVSDYEWYIAAEVSINESLNYKLDDSVSILTSIKSFPKLSATVKKINISQSTSRAVLILECSEMNSELATMRTGPITIVSAEYNGLKVSKSALRVVKSKRGVYVLSGMQVKFVPVNVLYSNDSYIICEKQVSDNIVLRLYDEVIVKGKNLYDGKIIS